MVETITPVVHGERARWRGTLVLHTLGATVTAAGFGAALGWVGGLLGAPWGRPGLIALAAAAAAYGIGELSRRRLPIPQLRRQVPDWWRTFFGRPVAAVLYGAGLGVGFFTYLAHGTFVVVALAAVASGEPGIGGLVVAPFGLVRGLSAALAWRSDTPERSRALVDRLASAPEGRRKAANALAQGAVLVAAAVSASRAPGGSWPVLAAAALAAVFSWSAVSKIVGFSRWRRMLLSQRLPRAAERVSSWSVPLGEAFVPVLVVTGSVHAAGAWALLLLAVFSIELVRVRRLVGARVPCGCFGGREAIDVRTALVRNAGLGLLAMVVTVFGHDRPAIRWPGVPAAADLVPSMLALGAVLAAALTAWRASAWLAKGRRA
jgi:hypothetical protein